jgi:hypothetical protein
MAYTINLTNGNLFATIPDGTINTTSSMTLIGKNYAGYGQFLDDNFIHLLENSANGTQPGSPLTGQLWYNTTAGVLNVYNGVGFKPLGGANASASPPTNNTTGDLWYSTTNQQLNVWTGTTWLLVGPVYTPSTGVTGAIPAVIQDTTSVNHTVIELYVGSSIVGIISKDAAFTPANTIPGFDGTMINPGIQLATSVGSQIPLFQGTAVNAQELDGVPAATYVQQGQQFTTLGLLNANAANVGNIGNAVTPFNTVFATATNALQLGGINANTYAVQATTPSFTGLLNSNGGNGVGNIGNATAWFGNIFGTAMNAAMLGGQPANSYISTSGGGGSNTTIAVNTLLNSGANGTGTIGNASSWFGTIYGTAINSLYADVAERFAADDVYDAGTVVELGGVQEITKSVTELSNKVFGVISTKPGYTMNGGAGDNATHPPVAMTGRVPVKVIGTVSKGDRLVSAGNGIARVALDSELTPFNVIGRALANKTDVALGTVEAIVTIKS